MSEVYQKYLGSCVDHSECAFPLGISQYLPIAGYETCADLACCRHEDEIRRVTVWPSGQTSAADCNARCNRDYSHPWTTDSPLDPGEWLCGKGNAIFFNQHRNLPHRDSRDEKAVMLACVSDRLYHVGWYLARLPLHCPYPYMGVEQERQAGRATCWHPTQRLWAISDHRTRVQNHACNPRCHEFQDRKEPASLPESRAW